MVSQFERSVRYNPHAVPHILIVDCKTPTCRAFHALKYLGATSGENPAPISIPVPLTLLCPYCEQTHDYATKDLRKVELNEEIRDFRDAF